MSGRTQAGGLRSGRGGRLLLGERSPSPGRRDRAWRDAGAGGNGGGVPVAETRDRPITIQFDDVEPGQQIGVSLTSIGAPVAFSTGPDARNDAGLQLRSLSGSIPLSQLSLNASEIRLSTSSQGSGAGVTGTLRAFLAADSDAETLQLRSTADPGVEVTAQIGNSVPQVVNETQTLFAWEPS